MTGLRGKNLRSGDLTEQLGILLLQNVALVAPIPRTEDVGIDLVATLLKDFNKKLYIAEESFFVQIKSSSISEITFKDEEVKWLSELQLPYFIAIVNKKTSTLKLYSTYHMWDVIATKRGRREIILEVIDTVEYDCTNKDDSVRVPTGPCVLSWSFQTLENSKNFMVKFHDILKAHILINKKAIETHRVGVIELMKWETGRHPVSFGTKIISSPAQTESDEIIGPYFNALIQRLTLGEDLFTTRSLFRLLEEILERHGHFTVVDGKKKLIPFQAKLKNDL